MDYELRHHFQIESSRYLPHLPKSHPCSRMHGHSFKIILQLNGNLIPKLDWLMDYNDLANLFQPILEQLDHRLLNEVPGLENPTSENLCKWIYDKTQKVVPQLTRVSVLETPSTECSYPGRLEDPRKDGSKDGSKDGNKNGSHGGTQKTGPIASLIMTFLAPVLWAAISASVVTTVWRVSAHSKPLSPSSSTSSPAPVTAPAAAPGTGETTHPSTSSLSQKASQLYGDKKYEEVSELLWQNIEKLDRLALLTLAKSEMILQRPLPAIKALNSLLSKDPKDFEAHFWLGGAYVLAKKMNDALEEYKAAIEINKSYQPAYFGIIDIYVGRNNLYELRMLYQDMIKLFGAKFDYYSKLCEINAKDDVIKDAIDDCKRAIQLNKLQPDPYVFLYTSYKNNEQLDEANKILNEAVKLFPTSELIMFTRASIYEDEQNYIDASKFYQNAVRINDRSPKSWVGLARSLFEVQKYSEALVAFNKACKLDKANNLPHFRKALKYLKTTTKMTLMREFERDSDKCAL